MWISTSKDGRMAVKGDRTKSKNIDFNLNEDLREREAMLIFTLMQIEKSLSTVFTPLADGSGVLLNLDTLLYYNLNRMGAILWQQIEDRQTLSLEDLVHTTCERFDVDEEAAQAELRAFVERLESFKMVRIG